MKPAIRRATEADLPQLIPLLQQLSVDAPREDLSLPLPAVYLEAFHAIDSDARQHLLVAELDGRIVGSVTVVIVPNLTHQGAPWAELENMIVDESARGQRIGEALVAEVIDIAGRAGCYKLTLTSNVRRTDAHRFYERLGFKSTHRGFRIDF
jgi:GNAT superfamily N-acetyltransferase